MPTTTTTGTTAPRTSTTTTTTGTSTTTTTTTTIIPVATYNVTFDANGHGEAPEAILGVTKLPTALPSMDNVGRFKFMGWTSTKTGTESVTPGSTIEADTTLYAMWEEMTLYEYIANSDGKIYNTDFGMETVGNDKDYEFGFKGIYSVSEQTDKLKVEVKNGKLSLTDTDDEKAAQAMIRPSFLYEGIVEGTLKFNFNAGSLMSKQDLVSVYGYTDFFSEKKLFALRSNASKKLAILTYGKGGNADADYVGTPMTWGLNTEYELYFKYDFNTNKLTVSVDGTAIVEDYELPEEAHPMFITGVGFMTANGATDRTETVDEFAISDNEVGTLADVKKHFGDTVDKLFQEFDLSLYTKNAQMMTEIKDNVKAGITAATTKDDVVKAFMNFAQIYMAQNDEQIEFDEAYTAAQNAIEVYVEENQFTYELIGVYTDYNVGDYQDVCENYSKELSAKKFIPAAGGDAKDIKTIADINELFNKYKVFLDTYNDNSQTLLTRYHSDYCNTLVENYPKDDYKESATDYNSIMDTFKNLTITSKSAIEDAYQLADTQLMALDKDSVIIGLAKENAKNEIEDFEKTAILDEEQTVQNSIKTIKENAIAAIDECTTVLAIQNVVDTAENAITPLLHPLADVIAEYNGLLNTKKSALLTKIGTKNDTLYTKADAVKLVDSTSATNKSKALAEYTASNDELDAIESEFDTKETAKGNIDTLVAGLIDGLLIDETTYNNNHKDGIDTLVATIKSDINSCALADLTNLVTSSEEDINDAFAAIKAATEVTVTYYVGGTKTDTFPALKNSKLTKPTDPEDEDCVFAHWCSDESLLVEFDFNNDTLTGDTNLYAKFYDIYSKTSDTATSGFENPTTVPTLTNWEFVGVDTATSLNVSGKDVNGNSITYTSAVKFGGGSKDSRYISFTITKDSKVFVAMQGGGSGARAIFINKTAPTSSSTSTIDNTYFSLTSNEQAFVSGSVLLEAGTYYIHNNAKDCRLLAVQIYETNKVNIGSISADITGGVGVINVSDVAIKDTNDNSYSLTDSYKVYIDDSETAATVVNGVIYDVPAGNHDVTVKYGKYTFRTYGDVTVNKDIIDEDVTIDLTLANTDLFTSIGDVVQGDVKQYGSFTIDATNGKFGKNNDSWSQFNGGAIIKFKVPAKTIITVIGYSSKGIAINDVYSIDTTFSRYFEDATTIIIKALDPNGYIRSISVQTNESGVEESTTISSIAISGQTTTFSNGATFEVGSNAVVEAVYDDNLVRTLDSSDYTVTFADGVIADGKFADTANDSKQTATVTCGTVTTTYDVIVGTYDTNIKTETGLVFNGNSIDGVTNVVKWTDNTKAGTQANFTISGTNFSNSGYLEFKNDDKIEFSVKAPSGKKAVLVISYYQEEDSKSQNALSVVKQGTDTITGVKDATNSSAANYIYTYDLANGAVEIDSTAVQNYLNYIVVMFVDDENASVSVLYNVSDLSTAEVDGDNKLINQPKDTKIIENKYFEYYDSAKGTAVVVSSSAITLDNYSFTKGNHASGNNNVMCINALEDGTITLYFVICDGSFATAQGNKFGTIKVTSSDSTETVKINGTDSNVFATTAKSNTTALKISFDVKKGSTYSFTITEKVRTAVLGILFTNE